LLEEGEIGVFEGVGLDAEGAEDAGEALADLGHGNGEEGVGGEGFIGHAVAEGVPFAARVRGGAGIEREGVVVCGDCAGGGAGGRGGCLCEWLGGVLRGGGLGFLLGLVGGGGAGVFIGLHEGGDFDGAGGVRERQEEEQEEELGDAAAARGLHGERGGELQVTSYKLQVSSYRLQVTGYRFQVTGYRLQVTGFKLQVTGYRLQVSSWAWVVLLLVLVLVLVLVLDPWAWQAHGGVIGQ
jgi:hypothetical protein